MDQHNWVTNLIFQKTTVFNDLNCYRTFYHNLFVDVQMLTENSRYKSLELQVDFLCQASRHFLETLDYCDSFSELENFKIHIVNFHDGQTVGLYVHYIKMIFKISSLKYFEISSIPFSIFEELKLWFVPGNIYFCKIRPFSIFLKPKSPNCMLFVFKGKPNHTSSSLIS